MRQFQEAAGVEDWRVLSEGACSYFRTGSFAAGARLVDAISQLPGLDDHRPDLDVRWEGVTVRLISITPDYHGLSDRDLELARQISAVARELGMLADPAAVQTVEVTIDALVTREVMPFWRAVLGYAYRSDSPEEDLVDPRGRLVSDEHAPEWWTLADAEGNEVDVANLLERD
jgi:4a-hydroxytetrahydrobiopterin dehydratase